MVILLIGAPGSGKGTISSKLIEENKFKQISTGDLLREEVASGSKLGKEINEIMKSGKFVSSELVNNLVKTNIEKAKKAGLNIVLDGYPRNIDQAKYLATYCKIDKVIELAIKEKILIERITGRWTCPKCKFSYNINTGGIYTPITKNGKYYCKKCKGTELVHRVDDNLESVQKRLDTYNEQTKPLIDFYSKTQKVLKIDGTIGADAIVKKILK